MTCPATHIHTSVQSVQLMEGPSRADVTSARSAGLQSSASPAPLSLLRFGALRCLPGGLGRSLLGCLGPPGSFTHSFLLGFACGPRPGGFPVGCLPGCCSLGGALCLLRHALAAGHPQPVC